MKLYKEEGNLIIDGEKDFIICNNREQCIFIDTEVEHLSLGNFWYYMIPNGFIKKLELLYTAGKYIFKGSK